MPIVKTGTIADWQQDLYNLKKAAVDDFASYSEDLKLFALESVSDEISSIVKNHYLTF